MTPFEIEKRYTELCYTESDINEHLPILREYADKCESVTEFGVRGCVSTFAFLASNAKKVTSYDILNVEVPEYDKFKFICANDLEIEIEPTDMLFVDTIHSYTQFKQELELHASKVSKFIAAHDTKIFGRDSDDGSKLGLLDALDEFLAENDNFIICYQTDINNGLTIIERIK
jgi:hypothetical protein